ncbi:phosphatidylglycerol lysyltransferase domain-containing protein [Alienimonas chondri]|uniref:Phosphatidylglycerol lysyltransferase C-terminal domain-containing protein n=1 Tax=Alienimonas chondri TaxID=2681879 RepID=A0ABX1VCL7_9PLAN|nr:phosphatidylglycerol lysyltransferase domain-containing protein [Alienimonas chondri]NNJ25840.1 hypothetical protein [Alienimonas chondri]
MTRSPGVRETGVREVGVLRDADPAGGEALSAVARRLALVHAHTADGLLVAEPGRGLLLTESLPGVAGPIRCGRTALIPGGPLAAPEHAAALVRYVEAWATPLGLSPLWLNVTAAELPALASVGYRPTRIGADCVVRHPGRWEGGRFRAVRAACGRATRAGVSVSELSDDESAWGDLPAIVAAHLAAKPQLRPATAFIAPPPAGPSDGRRVWIARKDGRTVGFASVHPLGVRETDGTRRWTLGGFHTHPEAPSGTAAALVRGLLDALAAEGVSTVSLGPAPAALIGPAPAGENPHVCRGVAAWMRAGNGLFDARGLWHFKSRFRPTLEPLFACGAPRVSVRQAADFVRASGVLRVDPRPALRGTFADLRRPAAFGRIP